MVAGQDTRAIIVRLEAPTDEGMLGFSVDLLALNLPFW